MSDLQDWKTIDPTDRDRLLAAYCKNGLTAQKIADKFQNCSRSAVIGRVHRLNLKLNNGVPRKSAGRRPKAAKPEITPKAPPRKVSKLVKETSSWRGANNPPATDFKARALQRAASPGIVIKRENAFDPIPGTEPVEAGSAGCKWPVDGLNGQGLHACGAKKEHPQQPYCRSHASLAYVPPAVRDRAYRKTAQRIS